MTNIMFCGNCEHLSPKESEQTDKKEKHKCKLYNVVVKHSNEHRSFHPEILACEQCLTDEAI